MARSMSYCCFENTAEEMEQAVDKIESLCSMEDLGEDEKSALFRLTKLSCKFVQEVNNFIDSDGNENNDLREIIKKSHWIINLNSNKRET
jgi:hypothetical protein